SYHGIAVLRDVTASYERGQTYYFRSPSGSGKTTLFRLIAGLEEPDCQKRGGAQSAERGDMADERSGGEKAARAEGGKEADRAARADSAAAYSGIERHGSRISMVFQEDRLCEEYSALVNVDMVTGDREKSREHLCRLLEEADLHKPCRELSGGMKRRVAVARAMAAGGDVILLDEPFSGLDAESRCRVEQYIHSHCTDRALLVATHTGEQ
ncbi:MAG: ATP-binding cassette domain-containing protein, partial [Acetatifactor sp.]|nr:ATP-binding cassette domain-containing protein [Acetatifactor sp.]